MGLDLEGVGVGGVRIGVLGSMKLGWVGSRQGFGVGGVWDWR